MTSLPPEDGSVLPLRNQNDVAQVISLHDIPADIGDFVILNLNSHEVASSFEPFFINPGFALWDAKADESANNSSGSGSRRGPSKRGHNGTCCDQRTKSREGECADTSEQP